MKLNLLTASILASGVALFANSANAAVTTDSHGNVGYDSYDECVTAVKSGEAKFYKPYTYEKPKLLRGEASVKKMALSDVTIPDGFAASNNIATKDYSAGACDLGVGQSNGRYGVSGELVGKYIPISPDMPVNVYRDSKGNPVRITMQQCDNHFGGKFPTPIVSEMKAPDAEVEIEEERNVEPVTVSEKRTVKPTSYHVKEVIVAPSDQVERVETESGTKVAIQDAQNRAVVVGEEANREVLDRVEQSVEEVPVQKVPPQKVPAQKVPAAKIQPATKTAPATQQPRQTQPRN
ncbi:hypothetical protein [Psychrobacter sp. FDAARGOS_221]|uniref:hypothetical protein n=1 Tax=Psychrobacter sp. FDAARGOS_221 TaxID=1975705 RepID=UPI00187D1902|nr:hypothetical protein [Psychrobacter sp. FDAARGOS_221]